MHDIPLWTGAGHQIEYPALNKMVSQITGRKQEIASIYSYNIGDLPDINVPASFNFCKDTNMNCLAELLIYIIRHRILKYLDQFNEDAFFCIFVKSWGLRPALLPNLVPTCFLAKKRTAIQSIFYRIAV